MRPDRREFLRVAGLGGLSLALRPGLGAWLGSADRANGGDRTALVLVELTGGNDGLNTIVPHADDRYHRARPVLRHAATGVHKIDEAIGFGRPLAKLAALFKGGGLTVVQGVGMPRHDRSHFTSLDRWHLGRLDSGTAGDGWLMRGIDAVAPAGLPFAGIGLGERVMPRVLQHESRQAVCCEDLAELAPPAAARAVLASEAFRCLDDRAGAEEDRDLAAAARALLATMEGVLGRPLAPGAFPDTPSGRLFADAFRLLAAGLDVPAIFVRRGGFDTHARQFETHDTLLRDVDGGLGAFATAVAGAGLAKRVLVIVYSEFGRRVAENGSRGTDHGSAAPVLMLGGGLPGGVVGSHPDLGDLDDGDVRPTIDFRRVLAQGLKHLGHRNPAAVLGAGFDPLV